MPNKKYDFFLPLSLTMEQLDKMQEAIKYVTERAADSVFGEISTSDVIYRAVMSYANVVSHLVYEEKMYDLECELEDLALLHFEKQAEPAPLLDNIETL